MTLLVMGYLACTRGYEVCNSTRLPFVSDVIVSRESYDRLFLFLTVIMTFGVMMGNIKAFYKKLYDIVPDWINDLMLDLGTAACFALPMVGIFDDKKYLTYHFIAAGVFFLLFGIYCFMLGQNLYAYRDKYSLKEQSSITAIYYASWGIVVCIASMVITPLFDPFDINNRFWSVIAEWVTVIYFSNFFSIASLINTFYDTVHEFSNSTRLKYL